MESVGRLAGGVAHDFNNMLSVILGHAELAMDQTDQTHFLYEDLREIYQAAERSADLTRQLLAFARKQTISPRIMDLNETVEGMLRMLRRLIGEDVDLVWEPEAQVWPVKMDPSQVDQILANLCVNAKDALPGGGKIVIETTTRTLDAAYCHDHAGFLPGDYVVLAVSDNGCGMSPDIQANLFEPFYTTKEVGRGTGLGLATIYGIVKQNNGFINVYSEPGTGTTFRIYIPRHEREAAAESRIPPAPVEMRGTETILLVEDEPAILKMTRAMLMNMGYRVLTAESPAAALRMSETLTETIHLLLTDVVMPGMNGRELAERLVRLWPELKVLYISGYTANAIAHFGVLNKGLNFIQKPFSAKDLHMGVRKALEGEGGGVI
jgi:CheY-like chemotaxis protein